MKDDIENTLKESIAKLKMISVQDITLDSNLQELGITSLDSISLVFDVEDKYGVEVSNEELMKVRTLRDIVDGVAVLISRKE